MVGIVETGIKERRKIVCRQIGGFRQIDVDKESKAYTEAYTRAEKNKTLQQPHNYIVLPEIIELEPKISTHSLGLKLMRILQQEGATTLFARNDIEEEFKFVLDANGRIWIKESKEVFEYWGGLPTYGMSLKVDYSPPRIEMTNSVNGRLTALITFLGLPQVFGQASDESLLLKRIKDVFIEHKLQVVDKSIYENESNLYNLWDILRI